MSSKLAAGGHRNERPGRSREAVLFFFCAGGWSQTSTLTTGWNSLALMYSGSHSCLLNDSPSIRSYRKQFLLFH